MENIFVFAKIKLRIKRNPKIIFSYNRLHAHIFRAHHKSLRAHYAHAYKHGSNFLRPVTILVNGHDQYILEIKERFLLKCDRSVLHKDNSSANVSF